MGVRSESGLHAWGGGCHNDKKGQQTAPVPPDARYVGSLGVEKDD